MRNEVFSLKLKAAGKFRRLLGKAGEKKGFRSGFVALGPGESVGDHNTKNKEEAIIILDGKGMVCCGKRKRIEVAGSTFIYIPPNTAHNISNTGRKILKYVYVTSSTK